MRSRGTHVFGRSAVAATHVFDAARPLVELQTLRYTLAGSPSGNLRADRATRS